MGAQSPPMMTSPHGYSEALKRNLQVFNKKSYYNDGFIEAFIFNLNIWFISFIFQGMMEDCNLSYMSGDDHMMQSEDYPSAHDDYR